MVDGARPQLGKRACVQQARQPELVAQDNQAGEWPSIGARPLLIAEAANPDWPSVPLIGWNFSRAIADRTGALVATQIRNKPAFLRAGLEEGRDFIVIDNEQTASAAHRLGEMLRGGDNRGWTLVTALSSLSYYSFERQLWRLLKDRLKAGEFSLVHRITPLSPTSQSLLAGKLSRLAIPFIVGPLNGGVAWPAAFASVRRDEGEWLSQLRRLYRLMPGYRATRDKAAALIAGSHATLAELPATCRSKSFLLPENAVDLDRFPFWERSRGKGALRVAFVGRLVPYKGADLLIEAVAASNLKAVIEVVVVGEGPQRQELEALVRRLGLERQVRFAGWVPNQDLVTELSDCQLLCLPSVREFGGGVVIEGMALGLVPVVANYGGPPELIDEDSGIAVDFSDRTSLIRGISAAIERLACDDDLLTQMSRNAGRRARTLYTWQAKTQQILQVYAWVLGKGDKPAAVLASAPAADYAEQGKNYQLLNKHGQNYSSVVSSVSQTFSRVLDEELEPTE